MRRHTLGSFVTGTSVIPEEFDGSAKAKSGNIWPCCTQWKIQKWFLRHGHMLHVKHANLLRQKTKHPSSGNPFRAKKKHHPREYHTRDLGEDTVNTFEADRSNTIKKTTESETPIHPGKHQRRV